MVRANYETYLSFHYPIYCVFLFLYVYYFQQYSVIDCVVIWIVHVHAVRNSQDYVDVMEYWRTQYLVQREGYLIGEFKANGNIIVESACRVRTRETNTAMVFCSTRRLSISTLWTYWSGMTYSSIRQYDTIIGSLNVLWTARHQA